LSDTIQWPSTYTHKYKDIHASKKTRKRREKKEQRKGRWVGKKERKEGKKKERD